MDEAATSLAERAQAALARVDDERAEAFASAWQRRPWSIGITGRDLAARAALFDLLVGMQILDPAARRPASAALRVVRGTRASCRGVRDNGSAEEHVLADADDLTTPGGRLAAARAELAEREHELERVQRAVPVMVRRQPAWWQIWLWVVYWFHVWRDRRKPRELIVATEAVDVAKRALAVAKVQAQASPGEERRRERYLEALRTLASAKGMRELAIEVTGGPLPEGVEIVELAGATRAASDLDAVVVVEGDDISAPLPDGTLVHIGSIAEALARLPELAARARAVKLARRTGDSLAVAVRAAGDELARAEMKFQAKFQQLELLRIPDRDAFVQTQRLRVRPQVLTSIHSVLEHASVHLGQELSLLANEWMSSIEKASADDLTAVIDRIETSSPVETQRIVDEVRLLVGNGIAGAAHDLRPELVTALRPYGLPEPPKGKITVEPVDLLPSLGGKQSKLVGAGAWVTGLFKSFESKRTAVREKAQAWLDRVKEVSNAELLDAEPRMHAALAEAVAADLDALVARQFEWLEAEEQNAREAVKAERTTLAPLAAKKERAEVDRAELAAELARIEAELPAVAAAAAAAVAA